MTKVKISEKKVKPFIGDDGEQRPYAWYKAIRIDDGVTFQFGSKNLEHEVGDEVEINLEKSEALRGGKVKLTYKEVSVE